MLDNGLLEDIQLKLRGDHFDGPLHGRVYEQIRRLVDKNMLATPVTLVAVVTEGDAVAALDVGDLGDAWASSVAVAAERHVVWHDRPYRRVLSYALDIYDELWTGAKAVYKLEPVVADGGELVVVAPGVAEVSRTHGRLIEQVGYHVLPYFLQQWDRVAGVPLAVVAHSTHVKGAGRYDDGRELPRIEVALATGIPADRCRRLNLGFVDPAGLRRRLRSADHDTLVVHGSGEVLHRLRPQRRSP